MAEIQLWQDTAAELTPARSLERIAQHAQFLAGSFSVVSSVLLGLGLLSIDRLRGSTIAFDLAIAAAALSVVVIVLALGAMTLRVEIVRPNNLLEVRAWYQRQVARAQVLAVAGWLLIAAVAVGASAAALALAIPPDVRSSLSVQVEGPGPDAKVVTHVKIVGLQPGVSVDTRVVGTQVGSADVVLFSSRSQADASGTVDVSGQAGTTQRYDRLTVTALPAGATRPYMVELTVRR